MKKVVVLFGTGIAVLAIAYISAGYTIYAEFSKIDNVCAWPNMTRLDDEIPVIGQPAVCAAKVGTVSP